MKPEYPLMQNDVVQLSPDSNSPGSFMIVTEINRWGAQGYVTIPRKQGESCVRAFVGAKFSEMEFIGHAAWILDQDGIIETKLCK